MRKGAESERSFLGAWLCRGGGGDPIVGSTLLMTVCPQSAMHGTALTRGGRGRRPPPPSSPPSSPPLSHIIAYCRVAPFSAPTRYRFFIEVEYNGRLLLRRSLPSPVRRGGGARTSLHVDAIRQTLLSQKISQSYHSHTRKESTRRRIIVRYLEEHRIFTLCPALPYPTRPCPATSPLNSSRFCLRRPPWRCQSGTTSASGRVPSRSRHKSGRGDPRGHQTQPPPPGSGPR